VNVGFVEDRPVQQHARKSYLGKILGRYRCWNV
jgi:hypothetical protein